LLTPNNLPFGARGQLKKNGRGGEIRTPDLLNPIQAR
jgi:hypothetical protein